jgi:hypothetical protein
VRDMINAAKARGCKRLFLFVASHGHPAGIFLTRAGQGGSTGYAYFTLGDTLEAVSDTITEVYVVIFACYSGGAYVELQGRGFSGEVVTSADRDSACFAHTDTPDFIEGFADSWREMVASDPSTRLDFFRAYRGFFRGVPNPIVRVSDPESHRIFPNAVTLDVPDVQIPRPKSAVTLIVPRPVGDPFPADQVVHARIRITNPSIAEPIHDEWLEWGPSPERPGYDVAVLDVEGVAPGQTGYSIEARGPGFTFVGKGRIMVGGGATGSQISAQPTPTPAPPFQVGEIRATFERPTTTYTVQATAPGTTLPPVTYRWTLETSENGCKNFLSSGNRAQWEHGGTGCNHQTEFHPGRITVVVSDSSGFSVTRTYERGSAPSQ